MIRKRFLTYAFRSIRALFLVLLDMIPGA